MNNQDWLQAQFSVLGSALIEPSLVPKVIQQTRATDFYGPCQTIYQTMRKLFQDGVPVDVVSLRNALGSEYTQYLTQLMEVTPTAANLESYIQICREQAKVMSVRQIAGKLAGAESSDAIRKLLDEANGLMVDKPTLRISTMADSLRSFMERHTGTVKYLTWPIPDLNAHLYADTGDFILVGGIPSSGKSAFALQCGAHWSKDMKVGFFSLETSSEKLFDRWMSSVTELSMSDIKRNNITRTQWDQIAALTPAITAKNLELIPAAGMTPADIRSVTVIRGYKLILIDYVQLLQSSGTNRTEQVTNISLALHRMAQDMGVTVVALSQLKRKGDDSTPESSDLRESGQLDQDADIIMMLKLENKDQPAGNRELYITKNKEGECFKTVLAFDGRHQTFAKAQRTGETISQIKRIAKETRRKSREAVPDENQMTVLPGDYKVPF